MGELNSSGTYLKDDEKVSEMGKTGWLQKWMEQRTGEERGRKPRGVQRYLCGGGVLCLVVVL